MRRAIFAAVIILLLGGIAWQVLRVHEPVYQRKPLSAWLDQFNNRDAKLESEAWAAVRHMGTNALPGIMAMFRSEDTPLQQNLMRLVQMQPFIRVHYLPPTERHLHALFALEALGPAASPAIPELVGLLQGSTNAEVRNFSAQALGSLGTTEQVIVATQAPSSLETHEQVIVPALVGALKDPDTRVRSSIAESLGRIASSGRIGKLAAIAVPALTNRLGCTDGFEFRHVTLALSKFRTNAAPAVPLLLLHLEDKDYARRSEAAEALKFIDPAAAAKADVK